MLNRKLIGLALGVGFLFLAAGCGGFSASPSVSPASFFLPGLMKSEQPVAHPHRPMPEITPSKELAQS
jgi:hypothetical protein